MSHELNFLKFQNPTEGEMVLAEAIDLVVSFMKQAPQARYRVMIGSDSNGNGTLDLVSVVAIHRVGNGGRYFWSRQVKNNIHTLRQKIYAEVEASLSLASIFLPAFKNALAQVVDKNELPFDFEIHVDVGMVGETKDLVHEITGMVKGYGYDVLIKPLSAAATSVADRHVR